MKHLIWYSYSSHSFSCNSHARIKLLVNLWNIICNFKLPWLYTVVPSAEMSFLCSCSHPSNPCLGKEHAEGWGWELRRQQSRGGWGHSAWLVRSELGARRKIGVSAVKFCPKPGALPLLKTRSKGRQLWISNNPLTISTCTTCMFFRVPKLYVSK